MLAREWIRKAQGQGWRVQQITGKSITMQCCKYGCKETLSLPMDNLGPIPEPCTAPHTGQYAAPTFEHYKTLVAELRRRRRELGLDQQDLCIAMGVTDGYVNKLESFKKTAQPPTLLLWAQTLGLTLTTAPTTLPAATLRAIEQRTAKPYHAHQARFKHDQ